MTIKYQMSLLIYYQIHLDQIWNWMQQLIWLWSIHELVVDQWPLLSQVHSLHLRVRHIPSCGSHYDINLLEDLHMMVHNPSPETNLFELQSIDMENYKTPLWISLFYWEYVPSNNNDIPYPKNIMHTYLLGCLETIANKQSLLEAFAYHVFKIKKRQWNSLWRHVHAKSTCCWK